MSQYFIKRGEKSHGPFSTKQVKSGLESGKLKDADLISESKDGPWQTVTEQFQEPAPVVEVLSEDLPAGKDSFFANVEIPAVATPVAQFPTPTKKNEREETEEGEDTKNNEENANLVVCPDCNKQVSKRASSCLHCGAPLKAFNVDDAKVKAKAIFGTFKQKAGSLKEKAEANPSIAGAMSKAKEVSKKAAEQASELKKSTGQQFEEGGAKEAGKHFAASLANPKYRVLACIAVAGVLLTAYFFLFSGSGGQVGSSIVGEWKVAGEKKFLGNGKQDHLDAMEKVMGYRMDDEELFKDRHLQFKDDKDITYQFDPDGTCSRKETHEKLTKPDGSYESDPSKRTKETKVRNGTWKTENDLLILDYEETGAGQEKFRLAIKSRTELVVELFRNDPKFAGKAQRWQRQ